MWQYLHEHRKSIRGILPARNNSSLDVAPVAGILLANDEVAVSEKLMRDERGSLDEQRIFMVQVCLVALSLALILIGLGIENQLGEDRSFGFFWYSFMAGGLGASTRMYVVRSVRQTSKQDKTWFSTLSPVFFGALMAGVTYMLFMSGVLSGDDGEGLLRTNLFPSFSSNLASDKLPTITAYMSTRPSNIQDVGKLMIWSFLAGYSEGFVMGILRQLERCVGTNDVD